MNLFDICCGHETGARLMACFKVSWDVCMTWLEYERFKLLILTHILVAQTHSHSFGSCFRVKIQCLYHYYFAVRVSTTPILASTDYQHATTFVTTLKICFLFRFSS